MRLVEATGPNMNLLIELTDIFFENFEINKDNYNEKELYALENPFKDNIERIEEFIDDVYIISKLYSVDFSLYPKDFHKFDDDNKEISASATYNPKENRIVFYGLENVTKPILAHELRHLIQFAKYASKKRNKVNSGNYRKQPVEIDAYWTDSFIDKVEHGVPENKEYIINLGKVIMKSFLSKIPDLSEKYKKHYYKKTIKGLIELKKLIHKGYEPSVENLKKFADVIDKKDEMSKLIDNYTDIAQIDKLLKSKSVSLEKIKGYDISKEPNYAITDLNAPSSLLPRNMNLFNIGYAVLYLMLINRKDILKVFLDAVSKTPRHKHNKVDKHDIILSASELSKDDSEDNQLAIQHYMLNHWPDR